MGYIVPSVLVYQDIITTSPPAIVPDMYTCIVGPAYKVIKEQELGYFKTSDISASFTQSTTFTVDPTTKLDIPSIKVVANGLIKKILATGLSVSGTNIISISNIGDIKVGDVVYSQDTSGNEFKTNITKIVSNVGGYDLYLKDLIPSGYTDFALCKEVSGYVPETVAYDEATGQLSIVDTSFIAGDFFISYRSLRLDLAGTVNSLTSVNEVEGQLGVIDPVDNPLAYGVYKALQNTITPVKYYGVDDTTDVGYTQALDYLSEDETIYVVIPLTTDAGVLSSYKTWAEQMSLPTEKKYKLIIGTYQLPETKILGSDISYTLTGTQIDSTNSAFVDWGLVPGDLFIDDAGNEAKIQEVLNNQQLVLESAGAIQASGSAAKIKRILTKDQQAEAIKEFAQGMGSKRFVLLWPDVVYAGDDGKVPSYYAACGLGGMISGFPPQKGFTNVALAGFTGAEDTNGYFRQDQLNIIAEGGVCILANQSVVFPTLLYVRHQLTTDMANIFDREISMVKTIDYLSIYFKKYLEMYIGRYNLVEETINAIRDTITIVGERLKREKISKLGAPLVDFEIKTLEPVAGELDRLNIVLGCKIPAPLNYIELHLQF